MTYRQSPKSIFRCTIHKFLTPCLWLFFGLCQQANSYTLGNYTLGNGYTLGPWTFSGYALVELVAPIHQQQAVDLSLDDLAMFGQGRFNRYLNPFFEIEYINQPLWTEGQGAFAHAGKFDLERLYNDILISDKLTLRIGKMLAPVGEWNQIHASPLVATTIRPLTTYLNFSEFISGFSVLYSPQSQWLPNIDLYYQPWTELLPKNREMRPVRYKNITGINLHYGDEFSGQIAFSVQHAELTTRRERQTLFTVDGLYDFDYVKFSTQLFYASIYGSESRRRRNHEWGGYLQWVAPVTERWSLVSRGETFSQRDASQSQQNVVLGVNFRTQNALVWKLEYVFHWGANLGINEGVYSSVGVMF